MLGSLMTLAAGVLQSSPSLLNSSSTRCVLSRLSGKLARTRPASEMSRSSHWTPADSVKARTIGSKEWVASMGASSVYVYTIEAVGTVNLIARYSSKALPGANFSATLSLVPLGRWSSHSRSSTVPSLFLSRALKRSSTNTSSWGIFRSSRALSIS